MNHSEAIIIVQSNVTSEPIRLERCFNSVTNLFFSGLNRLGVIDQNALHPFHLDDSTWPCTRGTYT